MDSTQSIATSRKSAIIQIIPVMLCFFAMGFVDLVGTASNYVQKDLGLTDSLPFTRFFLVPDIFRTDRNVNEPHRP